MSRACPSSALLLLTLTALATGQEKPPAPGPQKLPVGAAGKGAAKADAPAIFTFEADQPGVLTIVVRAEGPGDLVIMVTDEDGQPIADGKGDRDVGGTRGAEQHAATLPWAGKFLVRIEAPAFDELPFTIAAGWLPLPLVAGKQDPDGRPRAAATLELGKARNDDLSASQGDLWDWYAIRCPDAGTLTVIVRSSEGDLVLEAYAEGSFREPLTRSDGDLQGVAGNEQVILDVKAGTTIYVRVALATSESASGPYKLSSGLIKTE